MTVEQAKKRLEQIEGKRDPLLSSFHGGRVGFRRYKKKDHQQFERWAREAAEAVRLREFIQMEERKQYIKNNPKPSSFFASVGEIEEGKYYMDCDYGRVKVLTVNKNTVTIQTTSGYREARKPTFIYKISAKCNG
jgi:hypothetical protein